MKLMRDKLPACIVVVTLLAQLASCQHRYASMDNVTTEIPESATKESTTIQTLDPYMLDVGDEITIRVWGYDDMERKASINSSGDIYYPLLGRVTLAGRTIPDAQGYLTEQLRKYFIDPQVELISSTSRQQFYVFGEVNNPGSFSFQRPIILVEGIAKAGWFKQEANTDRVLLFRRSNNQYQVYGINFAGLLPNQNGQKDQYLQSGDLVYVIPNKITKFERVLSHIQSILSAFVSIESSALLWPQMIDAITGKSDSSTDVSISPGGTSSSSSSNSKSSQ